MMVTSFVPIIFCAFFAFLFDAHRKRARIGSRFAPPFLIVVGIVLASPAIGEVFVGAKAGKMLVDENSSTDPINIAANIGYEIDTWVADLSVVGEVNRTVDSGKTNRGENLDFNSNSIFIVWKTTGSLFATLRGGVAQTETKSGNDSSDNTGILIGCSLGTVIGRTRLQLEFTSLAGEANFIGIGLEF